MIQIHFNKIVFLQSLRVCNPQGIITKSTPKQINDNDDDAKSAISIQPFLLHFFFFSFQSLN